MLLWLLFTDRYIKFCSKKKCAIKALSKTSEFGKNAAVGILYHLDTRYSFVHEFVLRTRIGII
jgi:hypothetical protein